MSNRSPVSRNRLLMGASATALFLAVSPAYADATNPFARVANPAAVIAQAAQAQLAQTQNNSAASQRALASFAQASAIRASMDAAQMAARVASAAAQASVPNGLGAGGLQPAAGATPGTPLWLNANAPTQSTTSDGRTEVAVQQTAPQAILNWQTFNVGQKTDVAFKQPSTTSVVLNRVTDPAANPTKILGTISAPGTVLIMNANGVIFGGASQVNVGSLIAGAANITDQQFLNNGIYSTQTNGTYNPAFTEAAGGVVVQPGAQITTAAPSTVDAGGGYVMLLGTSVENDGSITTPMGQTLLAAGDNFLVRPGLDTTGANPNSTTAGSEVAAVLNPSSASGAVTNNGEIYAQQGDITLTGRTILQNGLLLSTTSVSQRGTIHLANSAGDALGSVTLTPNSVTQILPEYDSTATALNPQRAGLIAQSGVNQLAGGQFDNLSTLTDLQNESRVEIVTGGNVEFQGGSLTQAPGGQVAVSAAGRIQVDSNAVIDVSGSNITLPMLDNFFSVNIQGEEESDNPQNRDTKNLFNDTVFVDARTLITVPAGTGGYTTARQYTQGGVFNVTGEYANVGHTIGEWTASGGNITLSTGANGSVVAQTGSLFNIAGGSISYASGMTPQSYLLATDGGIYNVNTAPYDLTYVGLYTGFVENHPHWGVSQTFNSSLVAPSQTYDAGYTVGRDGGQLVINASTAVFEGQIDAGVVDGVQQTGVRPASIGDPFLESQTTAPLPGALLVGNVFSGSLTTGFDINATIGVEAPLADSLSVNTPIPSSRLNTVTLDAAQLDSFGLGGLTIDADTPNQGGVGSITVGAPLTLANGGQLNLAAATIAIGGGLTAHGGAVTAVANDGSAVDVPVGSLIVAPGTVIDTTGIWTNGLIDPLNLAGLAFLNGGAVSLSSTGDLILSPGSLIDASSGAAILPTGKTLGGQGGAVGLIANIRPAPLDTYAFGQQGLVLGGTIKSLGVLGGGALTLGANSVLIGDGVSPTQPDQLVLPTAFFAQGFSSYNIIGYEGVTVAPGADVTVEMPILAFGGASFGTPTGSNAESALSVWLPPVYTPNPVTDVVTQRAGASLTLASTRSLGDALALLNSGTSGVALAPITIGQGSTLAVDPGQSVTINAWGEIDVEGAITAPGGSISVVNTRPFELESAPDPNLSIWIGATADLDVAAQAYTALDQFGRPFGVVPNGGAITIGSVGGTLTKDGDMLPSTDAFVIVRPGAVLNASGTQATIDLATESNASSVGQPSIGALDAIASNGGAISLSSNSGLYIEGDLEAQSGGIGGAGGTLSLTLVSPVYNVAQGPAGASEFTATDAARQLRILTVDEQTQPSGLADGLAPGAADPALLFGSAHIGEGQIAAGGFANLSLYGGDAIAFNGNVNLSLSESLSLNQGPLSLSPATPNAQITLAAPYVLLNGPYGHIINPDLGDLVYVSSAQSQATANGTLTVDADQIDVQNAVGFGLRDAITQSDGSTLTDDLPGFASVALTSQGDIRFLASTQAQFNVGQEAGLTSVVTTGNLDLTAARIYPATDVQAFVIAGAPVTGQALSAGGTITIGRIGTGEPAAPDSVFGNLLFLASHIEQGGVVQAPFGAIVLGENDALFGLNANNDPLVVNAVNVDLLPGSVTSVSANGLTIPYGGTADGINYLYNGAAVIYSQAIATDEFNTFGGTQETGVKHGVVLGAQSNNIEAGAILDLSGGGDLVGAGFVAGSGGSVDVLRTPLVNANPSNPGAAADKVYAIVPDFQGGYAPIAPDAGAGNPGVGEQVTIGAGVPGLAAGTYTLLPSTYAVLPGAFRLELGSAALLPGVANLPNGSFETAGSLGIANTAIHNSLPTELILTPAAKVTDYTQYNQTSYSQFAVQQATTFGTARPLLPEDAAQLVLDYGVAGAAPPLTVGGAVEWAPATDSVAAGKPGALDITSGSQSLIEILGPGDTPTAGALSFSANDLTALNPGVLIIGGTVASGGGAVVGGTSTVSDADILSYSGDNGGVLVQSGAELSASQIFLISDNNTVTLQDGAVLSTLGKGAPAWDSSLAPIATSFSGIGLSNGEMVLLPPISAGSSVVVQSGAQLLAGGTIALSAPGGATIGDSVVFGAKDLNLAASSVNIGTASSLAAAQAAGILPAGWSLDQTTLDSLAAGNAAPGAPVLQSLELTVGDSVNIFGSVDINTVDPTTGKSTLALVLNTPAIYGFGSASDVATIRTGTFIWNGVVASVSNDFPPVTVEQQPGPVIPNGPGTGSGVLNVVADQIILGYGPNTEPQSQVSLDRLTLGFSTVNLEASGSIISNSKGTLSVYESQTSGGAGPVTSGGALNLVTPLLTGTPGSVMAYTTGGALTLTAPSGSAPASTASVTNLGAEVDLTGDSVVIDTAVALPTGKLVVNATNDIQLGSGALIDLSGRTTPMLDQTEYSWGGDVILLSAVGNIEQAAGSTINVSAVNNNAGTITVQAVAPGAGQVGLDGTLLGASTLTAGATGANLGGSITVDAQTLTSGSGSGANLSTDFAALNSSLDAGGFFGARSFDLKQGDLTVSNMLKAQTINISIDNGSLSINGTVDASGPAPGTISLAAMNDLTLAGGAVLDAHGTVLQADSYGLPIDAENRAHVDLTATHGTLTLAAGATIDVSSPDPTPQGDVELNVVRTDETSGNANIVATGPVTIKGAGTIAVNAFWSYAPTDPNGSIVQDNGDVTPVATAGADAGFVGLDQIDTNSQAFMAAADTNSTLQSNLAGLATYGSIFHLRPGVEIDSSAASGGLLTVASSLDLSAFRYSNPLSYGLQVDPSVYGSGEPGTLVIRAAGNLNIDGSVTDGFAPPPDTPDTANNGPIWSAAPLLPAGDLSWSIQLVSGADLSAADKRTVRPASSLAMSGASGNLTLSDSHYLTKRFEVIYYYTVYGHYSYGKNYTFRGRKTHYTLAGCEAYFSQACVAVPYNNGALYTISPTGADPSVVRTGTGNLDLIAGGNFSEDTLYGVYTAGTQSQAIAAPHQQPQAVSEDGTVLGSENAAYDAAVAAYQANYPTNGGDLVLKAGGDVTGQFGLTRIADDTPIESNAIGNWLWLQGGQNIGVPAAWWINFGSYVLPRTSLGYVNPSTPIFVAFEGVGTLGGGNLDVTAGGAAGLIDPQAQNITATSGTTTGLTLVVASTGRVAPDGSLIETGGGRLNLDVGGALNPVESSATFNLTSLVANDAAGLIVDMRGAANITAASVGTLSLAYGAATADDPRAGNPFGPTTAVAFAAPVLAPGDSVFTVRTRGDLTIAGAADPGLQAQQNAVEVSTPTVEGNALSWFTLWTSNSAINLLSAGGNISPESAENSNLNSGAVGTDFSVDDIYYYPPTLNVIATGGSIYYGGFGGTLPTENPLVVLAPSPTGQLNMLAEGSIYGDGGVAGTKPLTWAMSGAAISSEATPFNPAYVVLNDGSAPGDTLSPVASNFWLNGFGYDQRFAFGLDTVTSNLHARDAQPIRFYAVTGEILDLLSGDVDQTLSVPDLTGQYQFNQYIAAKSVQIRAGGDIVDLGEPFGVPLFANGLSDSTDAVGVPSLFVNQNATDVSVVSAGGNIYYANIAIAGPGTLEVTAGGNIYQGDHGLIESLGPIYNVNPYDHSSGASLIVMPGVGASGPDWSAFASLYFNAANMGDPEKNPADVAQTYQDQLYQWLQQRFSYAGPASGALAYFLALPNEQQSIFDLQVYFAELNASGLEFNDTTSIRYKSYIRGQEAIATLFPTTGADGQKISYGGSLTMASGNENFFQPGNPLLLWDSGIHTEFGGSIQIVAPGGAATLGAQGITPGVNTGVLTEGSGDIDIYSLDSIELGLSRVFTTFGGNIVMWSAEGDINAGNGAKGTVVFTPARRTYTPYGNVALSPTVPSSGAGIATLAPILAVPAGNINLVAPVGTVNAGEAGIRVSGNLNIAALQVINAANIEVKGTATGIPTIVAVNTGALTSAANAAAAVSNEAAQMIPKPAPMTVPMILTVQFLGWGE